jgi:WD40 repeat protein
MQVKRAMTSSITAHRLDTKLGRHQPRLRSRMRCRVSAIMLAACLTAWLAPASASAQYFGRNKVQYKDLNFEVLKTQHFDIYFYPRGKAGVEISARLAERWYARLSRIFGHELRGRQPLVLYASHPDFEQTNVIQDELGEGTGGVTEPLRRRIVLPLGGPLADTDHVIGHELVHAFQFDMTTKPDTGPGQSGANRLSLWFIEGMAEYLSIGPVDPTTAMWLRDAAQQDKLPSLDQLDDPKYFPYRWGHAFWAYVGGRWGDQVIRQMLGIAASAGTVDVAIEKVLGIKAKELSSDWQTAIRQAYHPVFNSTTPARETGRLVIKGTDFGGDLNVGPALSPDGRWIAFLSSRSFFSTDLYVADAAIGRIARKLTSTATNPHFSSLQFIDSAGAWDATRAISVENSGRQLKRSPVHPHPTMLSDTSALVSSAAIVLLAYLLFLIFKPFATALVFAAVTSVRCRVRLARPAGPRAVGRRDGLLFRVSVRRRLGRLGAGGRWTRDLRPYLARGVTHPPLDWRSFIPLTTSSDPPSSRRRRD